MPRSKIGRNAAVSPNHAYNWYVDVRENIHRHGDDRGDAEQQNGDRHYDKGVWPAER